MLHNLNRIFEVERSESQQARIIVCANCKTIVRDDEELELMSPAKFKLETLKTTWERVTKKLQQEDTDYHQHNLKNNLIRSRIDNILNHPGDN